MLFWSMCIRSSDRYTHGGIDMANSVTSDDVNVSTYHTVLKASPGKAIFGGDMLFDVPFVAT